VQAFTRLVRVGQVPTPAAVCGEMTSLRPATPTAESSSRPGPASSTTSPAPGGRPQPPVAERRQRTERGSSWGDLRRYTGWPREITDDLMGQLRAAELPGVWFSMPFGEVGTAWLRAGGCRRELGWRAARATPHRTGDGCARLAGRYGRGSCPAGGQAPRPGRRADALTRPRLAERLRAASRSALTVLSAPAGFGKTTILTEWLATVPDASIAWLSLDHRDNDPALFWTYVVTAVQSAVEGVGAGAGALRQLASSPLRMGSWTPASARWVNREWRSWCRVRGSQRRCGPTGPLLLLLGVSTVT
jgi:hypothetical protein